MRVFKVFLIIIAAVVVSGIVIVSTSVIQGKVETNQTQEALDPFYTPPNPLVGNPGEIIRTEPIADYPITGATATPPKRPGVGSPTASKRSAGTASRRWPTSPTAAASR